MFDMFHHDNNDLEFKFLHVLTRIESSEKWTECRLAHAKTKDGVYNPDAPALTAAEGYLGGNKKAKAARDSMLAAEKLQSSIEQCIADARSPATKGEEKSEARWSTLMTKQDVKLNFLSKETLCRLELPKKTPCERN